MLTTSARSLHNRQNARRTDITWTAANVLFNTNTLASSAEYEPAFIAVRPFARGRRGRLAEYRTVHSSKERRGRADRFNPTPSYRVNFPNRKGPQAPIDPDF